MTEESPDIKQNSIQEFGNKVGRVIRFFNRKGYGFIRDLNNDDDYFVHNTEIICKEGVYRKLYPGEYVSYNLIEREGKQVCSEVRGIMGNLLLVENEDHTYRVFPKSDRRNFNNDSSSSSSDESISDEEIEITGKPEPEKEFINKEAPEGIEVAEFDGLNINEEMG